MKRALLLIVLAAVLTVTLGTGTAGAAKACWRTAIDDWYQNGRLDNTYSVACYRDVLKHLTAELQIYSDLPEKVNRALQAALLARTSGVDGQSKTITEPSRGLQSRKGGPVERALDQLGPDRADSVPIPLLALGGVALLLIAAGAISVITRRLAGRRAPPK